jgi:hypothetical protein
LLYWHPLTPPANFIHYPAPGHRARWGRITLLFIARFSVKPLVNLYQMPNDFTGENLYCIYARHYWLTRALRQHIWHYREHACFLDCLAITSWYRDAIGSRHSSNSRTGPVGPARADKDGCARPYCAFVSRHIRRLGFCFRSRAPIPFLQVDFTIVASSHRCRMGDSARSRRPTILSSTVWFPPRDALRLASGFAPVGFLGFWVGQGERFFTQSSC